MKKVNLYRLDTQRMHVSEKLLNDVKSITDENFATANKKNYPLWSHTMYVVSDSQVVFYKFDADYDNPVSANICEENEINQISNLDGLNVLFDTNSIVERAFFRRMFPKAKIVIKPEKADIVVTSGKLCQVFYANDKYFVQNCGTLHNDLNLFFKRKTIFKCNEKVAEWINEFNLKVLTDDYIHQIVPREHITASEIYDLMQQLLSDDPNLANLAKSIMIVKDCSKYPILIGLLAHYYQNTTNRSVIIGKLDKKSQRENEIFAKYLNKVKIGYNPKSNLSNFLLYITNITDMHPSLEERDHIELWLKMLYDAYHEHPYFRFHPPKWQDKNDEDVNEIVERFIL